MPKLTYLISKYLAHKIVYMIKLHNNEKYMNNLRKVRLRTN